MFLYFQGSFVYAEEVASTPLKQIRILLVPGHDNEVWGAQYGNIKEADMTLSLASELKINLEKDKRFKVFITRNWKGYTEIFSSYLANNKAKIKDFKNNAKKDMKEKILDGSFLKIKGMPHISASEDTSIKLYGFNKWANENQIDAVIHIHFNDYPRAGKWVVGEYKGFVIYIPDGQFANWKESGQLAANIFTELNKKYKTSNYSKEIGGLTSDQSLIALGSNNSLSLNVRSILIEYGYLYEKIFRNKKTRHQAYKDMANLTAEGIKNYFFP